MSLRSVQLNIRCLVLNGSNGIPPLNSRSQFTLFHHTQTGFTLWTPNHLGDKQFRSRLSKYRSVKWSCWNEIVPKQYLHVFLLGSNQLFTITRKWGYNGIHYSWIELTNINRLFMCRTTCQRLDLLQQKLCRIHLPLHFWVGTSEIRQRILGQLLVVNSAKYQCIGLLSFGFWSPSNLFTRCWI